MEPNKIKKNYNIEKYCFLSRKIIIIVKNNIYNEKILL